MSKRYRPWTPEQAYLLPPSPMEWLPEGHLAYFVLEVVAELDLSAIELVLQKKDPRGERSYAPQMMTALLQITPQNIIGTSVSYSNPVTCATTTTSVWALPRAGGAAKTLFSFPGFQSAVVASGGFIYHYASPCGGSSPATLKRHDIATGAEADLARDVDSTCPQVDARAATVPQAPRFDGVASACAAERGSRAPARSPRAPRR